MGSFYDLGVVLSPATELLQGDIVFPIPFVGVSIGSAYLLTAADKAPRLVDLSALAPPLPEGSSLVGSVEFGPGIILSQSCDLAERPAADKPILIARIRHAETIKGIKDSDVVKQRISKIDDLKNPGKSPTLFYLPRIQNTDFTLERSIATLLEVQALPYDDRSILMKIVKLRLTETARNALQERCSYCFGRFGAPDDLYYDEEESEFRK